MPGRKRRSSPINCGGGRRLQPAGSPLCRWPGAEFWQGKKTRTPGCSPPGRSHQSGWKETLVSSPLNITGRGGRCSPFLWSPVPPWFCTGVFVSTGLRPGSLERGRKQGMFLPPVDFQVLLYTLLFATTRIPAVSGSHYPPRPPCARTKKRKEYGLGGGGAHAVSVTGSAPYL